MSRPKIHYWSYTLRSAAALNARTRRTGFDGVLIRSGDGFGCLHPWPSLGDEPLARQLTRLAKGESTPLIQQTLRCAEVDGAARREGRSLLENPVPESHWLAMAGDEPEEVRSLGFTRVKLKLGLDFASETERVRRWAESGLILRFDGNETLSLATFLKFWNEIREFQDRVELVEDPTEWGPTTSRILREVGVPLAVDREVEDRFRAGDVAVLKPALSEWIPPEPERYLVTSYMDHAIGQYWAAAESARIAQEARERGDGRMLTCGLMTHHCFEPDPFFERIQSEGPHLLSPGGTGLGFDDLLEKLPWKLLEA